MPVDEMSYQPPLIKSRKLNFTIVPYECIEVSEYLVKVELLLQYLQKSESMKQQIRIVSDTTGVINSAGKAGQLVLKVFLRDPSHPNPKWIYLRVDSIFDIRKCFHIEIHWVACDSWLLEDYITLLFRRCSGWGIRIVQTPEYFHTSNLQVLQMRCVILVRISTYLPIDSPFPSASSCESAVPRPTSLLFLCSHCREAFFPREK